MFDFCVRSDVFHAGRDECGDPVEQLVYYVVATAASGRRFIHNRSFLDNGIWKAGETAANRLLDRINKAAAAGVEPDWDAHWHETDPAYGSEAYQSQGIELERRNGEIMTAYDHGEIGLNEALRLTTS